MFGGVGKDQTALGSFCWGLTFVFQKGHIGSNLENRSEVCQSEHGWTRPWPRTWVQGKMMSTYTSIMVVEIKRSGWISVTFQRENRQEWVANETWVIMRDQEVSRQTPQNAFHLVRGIVGYTNDVGNKESWPGLWVGKGIVVAWWNRKCMSFVAESLGVDSSPRSCIC